MYIIPAAEQEAVCKLGDLSDIFLLICNWDYEWYTACFFYNLYICIGYSGLRSVSEFFCLGCNGYYWIHSKITFQIPPYHPPFLKGGYLFSPFEKGGLRGIIFMPLCEPWLMTVHLNMPLLTHPHPDPPLE